MKQIGIINFVQSDKIDKKSKNFRKTYVQIRKYMVL
jgi:hypothetical protein